MKALALILISSILLSACQAAEKIGIEAPSAEQMRLSCADDSDCVCGGIDKATGKCFVGNRAYYVTNVDKEKDCPDFCTGIAANLETRCVEGMCKIAQKAKTIPPPGGCSQDTDCVIGGCSNQLCLPKSAGNIMSTCEWKEEYGCYQLTTCGCSAAKCAWKQNDAFDKCLGA